MAQVSQVNTPDNGISWHVEQRGAGPHIILIPSGEGDCGSFENISSILSSSFTVTTFDLPGFSRTTCPSSALADLTPSLVATQIISLLNALSINKAIVYGSSSGGLFSIALLQKYPEWIEHIIVHEVPMRIMTQLNAILALPDEQISAHCKEIFANHFNEDKVKWGGLGEAYHKRLEKNYVTWLKNYPPILGRSDWDRERVGHLREKINWSVGALMPMRSFFDNVLFCGQVGIPIRLLQSKHFPQVSIPEALAEHIRESCK